MAAREVYEFGPFTLDATERRLWRQEKPVALAPKSYDLLLALVRRAGRLTTKRELLDEVWPEAFVEEGILSVHISTLRKALDDHEPQRRYIETVSRTGYRFVAGIKRLAEEEPVPAKPSVAVLPARLITGEILSGRDRYTGLAIADALIDCLGRSPEIIVRPTRAMQAYMNGHTTPAAIGQSLLADTIVDTRFTTTEDQIRVAVDLVRSSDGAALWTRVFNGPATNVMSIASKAAACIASKLGSPGLHERAVPHAIVRPPAQLKVYELFGRGRFHLLAASMFEVPKAIEAFQAALDLDPTYAPAHAGLALACCAQATMRIKPPAESYNEARVAALKALAMDDSCADAQVALGSVLFLSEWNWEGAERSFQRALHLNPNHSEAYLLYGQLLEAMGRLEDGLAMKMRALERDPFSPLVHLQISLSWWNQRRYDEAIDWATKTLELDPQHPHVREHIAGAYWKKGDPDRWMQENLRHADIHKVPEEVLQNLKQTYAAGGRAAILQMVVQRLSSQPDAVPAMQLAVQHGELGNMDLAFQYLDKAIDSRDPCMVHLAVGPQWDSLRNDPRFTRALSRIGLSSPNGSGLAQS